MSNETTPKPPPAVRLARVTWPDGEWEDRGNSAFDLQNARVERSRYYELFDLNDLALAERRVCEAGKGSELASRLWQDPSRSSAWYFPEFANAPTRAVALIALLDAHPELEARLTKHE